MNFNHSLPQIVLAQKEDPFSDRYMQHNPNMASEDASANLKFRTVQNTWIPDYS